MPPPLLHSLVAASLPAHCEPSSPFLTAISSHLHICLPTPLALISTILGNLSFVSWLFAQLPQIYKNYQVQSTSGLSIFFLVIWCGGDISNLVGAILTRQAGWQVMVASYYVLVDLTLVIQFIWYTHYKPRQYEGYSDLSHSHHHHHHHQDESETRGEGQSVLLSGNHATHQPPAPVNMTQKNDTSVHDMGVQTGSTLNSTPGRSNSYTNEKKNGRPVRLSSSATSPPFALPRTMLIASMVFAVLANATSTEPNPAPHPPIYQAPSETIAEIVGRIFSWMSTILYLGSRPPQLYKNYVRKSTEGLSPLLFMAAFSGNFFYSSSLLTNPNAWYDFAPNGGGGWADSHGNDRWEWIGRSLPFFLGAFGVLGLDGYMGVQFLMYGSEEEDDESFIDADDEDPKRGRSRWRKVRGWMRGWIPSTSPYRGERERSARPQEGQALLSGENGRYGTV